MDRTLGLTAAGTTARLKILVFGAGALGTAYAGLLGEAGHDVTVLARGDRLRDLSERGVVLRVAGAGEWRTVAVGVTETVEGAYDLAVVLVRLQHLPEVLPMLASNNDIPLVLVMVQNAGGYAEWLEALGERLVVGFAGMGASFAQGGLQYTLSPRRVQPTTLGEPRGGVSERVERLVALLESAGLPAAPSADMDAWQRWHVAWIVVMACVGRLADYDVRGIRAAVPTMVTALFEGRDILRAAGVPLQPAGLRWLYRVPRPVLRVLLAVALRLPAFAREGLPAIRGGGVEGRLCARQMVAIARAAGVPSPTWDAFAA